jgi:hypothetical protein
MSNKLLTPWQLRNVYHPNGNPFTCADRVAIDTRSGLEICECSPIMDQWTPDEIARVHAMRAGAESLEALCAIRKIVYASGFESAQLRKDMLKCLRIAEVAISAGRGGKAMRRTKKEPK